MDREMISLEIAAFPQGLHEKIMRGIKIYRIKRMVAICLAVLLCALATELVYLAKVAADNDLFSLLNDLGGALTRDYSGLVFGWDIISETLPVSVVLAFFINFFLVIAAQLVSGRLKSNLQSLHSRVI